MQREDDKNGVVRESSYHSDANTDEVGRNLKLSYKEPAIKAGSVAKQLKPLLRDNINSIYEDFLKNDVHQTGHCTKQMLSRIVQRYTFEITPTAFNGLFHQMEATRDGHINYCAFLHKFSGIDVEGRIQNSTAPQFLPNKPLLTENVLEKAKSICLLHIARSTIFSKLKGKLLKVDSTRSGVILTEHLWNALQATGAVLTEDTHHVLTNTWGVGQDKIHWKNLLHDALIFSQASRR
jgi:hypothetical protein